MYEYRLFPESKLGLTRSPVFGRGIRGKGRDDRENISRISKNWGQYCKGGKEDRAAGYKRGLLVEVGKTLRHVMEAMDRAPFHWLILLEN